MSAPCPLCACTSADGSQAHALLSLLITDDIDAAMEAGLLTATTCPDCSPSCMLRLLEACNARIAALAARERYRARTARLVRRKDERDAARIAASLAQVKAPALPTSAADALARALAKARTPR
ncbi:MAG: hypothetical protein ABIO61_05390 [Thermomonas sp.]